MNVLYFCTDLFIHVAATSIVSLMENNKAMDNIVVYLVDDGISYEKKKLLEGLVDEYKRKIVFLPAPDPSEFFQFPFKNRYQMGHSYMRMCIGTLVPDNVDKLLVLDSDTLVLGNLKELVDMDMGDNILAGVADYVNVKAYNKQFMLDKSDIYCNAGIFFVNLKAWRDHKIEEKIRNVIKEKNGNIFFFEQTLINHCCKGKIIKLHPKYNCYTLFYAFKYKNLLRWRKPTTYYNEDDVKEAKANPLIIHFTRNFYMLSRPWIENCDHTMTKPYLKYKRLTPWKFLEKDHRSAFNKMKYKLIHLIPQRLLMYIVNVMYNLIRPRMSWKNE